MPRSEDGLTGVVLMTCHNRRAKTLEALTSLFAQDLHARLHVFLVDDGSTDGTAEAVSLRFPEVQIIRGSGSLFWAGGMRLAYEFSSDVPRDFTVWLNDDVSLWPHALSTLRSVQDWRAREGRTDVMVVGAFCDPSTGTTTYTGLVRDSRLRPLRFQPLTPTAVPLSCDTVHGNLVLISEAVREAVGNLDAGYTHAMGDMDYALRAKRRGFEIWLAPGHVGTCPFNEPDPTPGSARQRLRKRGSVKELPPSDWRLFARRFAGPAWPLYWASPYLRAALGRH